MSTRSKLIADTRSHLYRASPDEPVFLLRGIDPMAPYAVRQWAAMAEREKAHEPEKIAAARAIADDMEAYRRKRLEARKITPPAPSPDPEVE